MNILFYLTAFLFSLGQLGSRQSLERRPVKAVVRMRAVPPFVERQRHFRAWCGTVRMAWGMTVTGGGRTV